MRPPRSLSAWIAPVLVASLCAGCANDDGGGTGGEGGGGTTTTSTSTTTPTCTLTPTGEHQAGTAVAVDPASAFDTPHAANHPAVATNGAVHFAAWTRYNGLYGARLDADGTPLDVPARLLKQVQGPYAPAVAWDGSQVLVAFPDGQEIRMTRVDPATGAQTPPVQVAAGEKASGVALAAHDGVALIVWRHPDTGVLRGLRLGADGAPLDAAPIEVTAGAAWGHRVTWDGSSFVVAWAASGIQEVRAARVSPAGQVLDPGGVLLVPDAGDFTLLGTDDGSVLAWADEEHTLFVTRLSPALTPVDPVPAQIESLSPVGFTTLGDLDLSRSAGGDWVLGWVVAGDTGADYTAHAQALAQDLSPVGDPLSRPLDYVLGGHALVGLPGADHLTVRAAELLHSEKLTSAAQGLTPGGEHPIFLSMSSQEQPAVAGGPDGYLAVWREEDGSGGWSLRARGLDPEGAPAGGEALTLPAVPFGSPYHVASAGSDYLVLWRQGSGMLELGHVSPSDGLQSSIVLTQEVPAATGLACQPGTCLVVWIRNEPPQSTIYGMRVSGSGEPIDMAPAALAQVDSPGANDLLVAAAGDAFGVFWKTGAVRVGLDGAVEETPAFVPKDSSTNVAIVGSPSSLLAARHVPVSGGAPAEAWLYVFDLDGKVKGKYHPADSLGEPGAATWDGAAYVVLTYEKKAFVLTEEATLAPPAAGIDIVYSNNASLASSTPGRTVVLSDSLVPEYGVPRLFAQPLNRSDASICDP